MKIKDFTVSSSKKQQEADIPVSGQRCHPEQQEERTGVHQRLRVCARRCLLSCCQVDLSDVLSDT